MAPGQDGNPPTDTELGSCCNLGYAHDCARLPKERAADAVHFCVAGERDGVVSVGWVMVKDHAAAGHGKLEFEAETGSCGAPHADATVQRMAECYVQTYLQRKQR